MFKDKRLIPIFIVVFIDLLGFSLILPLLPYYASHFQASGKTIGLLVASYSICQFLAAPFLGNWSDRYGRRPLLLYSQLGSCLGFILLGLAPSLPQALFWLFVARIIDGLSGGNLTIAQAYISDISAPEDRTRNFGMVIGVSFGLGFLFGPTFGGVLSRWGYSVPAYAAAVLAFASVLATYFLLPETQHQRDENRATGLKAYTRVVDYLSLPEVRRWLGIFFFNALPFALYVTMFSLFAKTQLKFTAEQTGYFLSFVGLLGVIWQGGVVGRVVRRIGDYRTLVLGLSLSALGMYYIALVDVWWKLSFVAFFFSLGHGLARPALTSLITQAAPPNRRGGIFGATTSLESFSRIVAPIAGGWIIEVHPTWLGWLGGALFTVAVLIAFSASTPALQPEPNRASG
jgi:MFS transporter, DHA1 family, tetracycline resistance protein